MMINKKIFFTFFLMLSTSSSFALSSFWRETPKAKKRIWLRDGWNKVRPNAVKVCTALLLITKSGKITTPIKAYHMFWFVGATMMLLVLADLGFFILDKLRQWLQKNNLFKNYKKSTEAIFLILEVILVLCVSWMIRYTGIELAKNQGTSEEYGEYGQYVETSDDEDSTDSEEESNQMNMTTPINNNSNVSQGHFV